MALVCRALQLTQAALIFAAPALAAAARNRSRRLAGTGGKRVARLADPDPAD